MPNSPHLYLLLFSLYWAQGLPVGFMTHALPVILRAEGVSLAHIGGFGLLMLPWSIKVFWAPWVDRFGISALGHYRSWIIPTQIFSILLLIFLSFLPIQSLNQPIYLWSFFVLLFALNLVGATQDIATDGLAVQSLQHAQQHWGNTIQVIGSRLGFIVGGGALLWVLDWLTWQATFLLLALGVALNTLPILFLNPKNNTAEVKNISQHVCGFKAIVQTVWSRFIHIPVLRAWLMVLLTFKITDGLSGPIMKPLMVDMGLSFSQIGLYITMLGAVMALIGAGLAGAILKWCSRASSLMVFSLFKVLICFAYAGLAYQYQYDAAVYPWQLYTLNAIEDFISAMLLVVMLTLVMQYSQMKQGATDFTFQVSVMATVSGFFYIISGVFAEYLGYTLYLLTISLFAMILLWPIYYWMKMSNTKDQT